MRTFISIDIPEEIKDSIYDFQSRLKKLDLDASYTFKKQFHLTLLFLGELKESEIDLIKNKLKDIKISDIKIKLNNLGTFSQYNIPKVVWIGIESNNLNNLVNSICKSIEHNLDRPFSAHLTLCRIKSKKNIELLNKIIKENKDINFGSFKAQEFLLKQSIPDKGRHIHKVLAKFKLN